MTLDDEQDGDEHEGHEDEDDGDHVDNVVGHVGLGPAHAPAQAALDAHGLCRDQGGETEAASHEQAGEDAGGCGRVDDMADDVPVRSPERLRALDVLGTEIKFDFLVYRKK